MKTTPALNRVMKWAWRGHWDPFIQVVYEDHLGALLDEFDVPYLEAPRLLVETSTSTVTTPGTFTSSALIACSQCEHVIPVTSKRRWMFAGPIDPETVVV